MFRDTHIGIVCINLISVAGRRKEFRGKDLNLLDNIIRNTSIEKIHVQEQP